MSTATMKAIQIHAYAHCAMNDRTREYKSGLVFRRTEGRKRGCCTFLGWYQRKNASLFLAK